MTKQSWASALLRVLPLPFIGLATCGAEGSGCGTIVIGDNSGGSSSGVASTTSTSGHGGSGNGGSTGTVGSGGGACQSLWSSAFGDGQSETDVRIVQAPNGNVVLAGFSASSLDFGLGALAPMGSSDIVLATFDCSGQPLWSKRFGPTGRQSVSALAVDVQGNIFLAGSFETSLDFGNGNAHSGPPKDNAFLAKLDAQGTYLWGHTLGQGMATSLAVDEDRNVAVAGQALGPIDLGNGQVSFDDGGFVAKYDPEGAYQWGVAADRFHPESVAFTPMGDLVVAGEFHDTVDIGFGSMTHVGKFDLFVAEWSPSGVPAWAKSYGTAGVDNAYEVATDGAGNVYVAGGSPGPLDVGGGAPVGGMFVFKLDPTGTFQWVATPTAPNPTWIYALAHDPNGNVYVAGDFANELDWGPCSLAWQGHAGYLVGLDDKTGSLTACHRYGGASYSDGYFVRSVAIGPSGNVAVAGTFVGSLDLGSGPLAAKAASGSNKSDIFAGFVTP